MNEAKWNEWLRGNIEEVLQEIGIEESQTVLDFGCGPGAYAMPAAKLVGRKGRVCALDKDKKALKKLKEKAQKEGWDNIETLLLSELDTGLEEGFVDVVLLYDVIHLIEDRAALFEEVYRILKPDGLVSIYPMHMERGEVLRQMQKSHFSLRAEKYKGHILNFGKEKD